MHMCMCMSCHVHVHVSHVVHVHVHVHARACTCQVREVIAKGQFALPIERANFWTALRDISRFVSKEGVADEGGGSATDDLSPAARAR